MTDLLMDVFGNDASPQDNVQQNGSYGRSPQNYNMNDDLFNSNQMNYNGAASDQNSSEHPNVFISPEQMQRKEKLRLLEEERLKQVRQRDEEERREKDERKVKARTYLDEFKCEYTQNIEHRKKQNRDNQQILYEARRNKNEYRNEWDKVVSNISLKDGEYQGKKDVAKMRQAIVNKKTDVTK